MPTSSAQQPNSLEAKEPRDPWRDLAAASWKPNGSLYARYINRNAAIPLTRLFWRLGLHPNAVTLIGFATTHTALILLVALRPSVPVVVAAWLLLALGKVLDSCDGQLARVSGRTSRLGEWLDHSLDIVKILNLNMALSYVMISHALAASEPLTIPLAAAFLNLLAQPSHFCSAAIRSLLLPSGGIAEFGVRGGASRLLHGVLSVADYGVFIFVVLLLPWMHVFTTAYLLYGVFFALLFALYLGRSAKQMIALEPQDPGQ